MSTSTVEIPQETESCAPLDNRLSGVLQLLQAVPLTEGHTALDIGTGAGQIAIWLANNGLKVSATGLAMASYDVGWKRFSDLGIHSVECFADSMPFEDESFDLVVMSHVLEHCPNHARTLEEVKRVMKPGGTLAIFVPQHTSLIHAGHVAVGWNVGQLMYVLLSNGLSVKNGKFIEWQGSVCALVTKDPELKLPTLRGDRGDLKILADAGLFPLKVATRDGSENFCGDIGAINWAPEHVRDLTSSWRYRIFSLVLSCIPLGLTELMLRIARARQRIHRMNPSTLS